MVYTFCPERDLSLDYCRMAAFEDCQATMLTTQPPRLDNPAFRVIRSKTNMVCPVPFNSPPPIVVHFLIEKKFSQNYCWNFFRIAVAAGGCCIF